MAIFRFTSADCPAAGEFTPARVLLLSLLFLGGSLLAPAGTLITLTSGSEVDGKLSVTKGTIHVDSAASPPEVALTDLLEANFGDDPFHLSFFSAPKGSQLPADWTAKDIGPVASPGSVTFADGIFTLIGGGMMPHTRYDGRVDNLFFVGRAWPDNGEFTARLASLDGQNLGITAGIMLRETLEPGSPMCGVQATSQGVIQTPFRVRTGQDGRGETISGDVPLWLRLTRRSNEIDTSVSSDGTSWNFVSQGVLPSLSDPLVGLIADGRHDADPTTGQAVFDHFSLTPLPSSARILPPGALLQGGTLLAGRFDSLRFDANSTEGEFDHAASRMSIPRSAIAAVINLPFERSQLAELAAKPGILMKNGDTMDGDISAISRESVAVNSVLLGISDYQTIDVRACFIQALQPQPAAFEVRLQDGSIINATALAGDASGIAITDVSGISIHAAPAEIAQVRAGSALVQDLAPLDWVAKPPPPAADAAAPGAKPAAPAPPPPPPVQSWLGNNQEQILETGMGTTIEFALPGKFRALGSQIALASDSPPNATMTIHILADGKEIAKSPDFRAGDPPRFLEVTLQNPAHVTLRAESMFPGTKVLYIDPVAIRD